MKLAERLLLFDYLTSLLGGDAGELRRDLKRVESGRRADGQSFYFSVLETRGALIQVDRSQLAGYDMNILGLEHQLGNARPNFRLTYFQYLAALYTEMFLHRLATDADDLLRELRIHRSKGFAERLSPLKPSDLRRAAFWMATGSGKTLLAHAHLMQFLWYQPFIPDNVLLITPSATMTKQHLEELSRSGISARHALASGGPGDVQVLEITKLYVDRRDVDAPRGGESLPTSAFEGRNLVLVDEGHKGSTSASDQDEERKWRDIRGSLAGDHGFTFEYSATFAQITESNDELLDEYGKSILFDYGYKHFWEDGYGKDYRVVNLKEEGAFDPDELLLAGLVVLYEQSRYFADSREELEPYNVEQPLMVFIGATVTGQVESEVLQIVRFLDRVVSEPSWARDRIQAIRDGTSGLPVDLFSHRFPYLTHLGQPIDVLYADLCARLFHGTGRLAMHMVQRADGEIGLRTADSQQDVYCGVVNVGNATGFAKNAEAAGIARGEDDHITESVFDAIDLSGSSVNFLIGSKKFIEGWSSWRVSVMGLLKVGRAAGPQVIQLFGRGVRLKGKDMQLRRSSDLLGSHPDHLSLLETLHIFGLKADYMQTFNETIRREGVPPPVTRVLPIFLEPDLDSLGLTVPDPGSYDFFRDDVVTFDPTELPDLIEVDLMPSFTLAEGIAEHRTSAGGDVPETQPFPADNIDPEPLFLDLLDYKRRRDWHNTYITRPAVRAFLKNKAMLTAPAGIFIGSTQLDRDLLQTAARDALHKGLERYVYAEQRRRETSKLQDFPLTDEHANFPRVKVDGDSVLAYRLEVPETLVKDVDVLVAQLEAGTANEEDIAEPLPRLHLHEHLYNPLLVKESDIGPAGRQLGLFAPVDLRSTPSGLVESEVVFLRDLREFWAKYGEATPWCEYRLHVLRNLPRRGVGFFQTAGFYPDFIIWLVKGGSSALAFVEPHGMVIWDQAKVELLSHIRELGLVTPTVAYIVTKTPPKSIGAIGGKGGDEQWLRERHILLQGSSGYIEEILRDLRNAVEQVIAGQYEPGRAVAEVRQVRLRLVPDEDVEESQRFVDYLPVYSLRAAAGYFGAGHDVEREGWARVEGRVTRDMFVAQAVGHSMESRIQDGDLCVFRTYRGGTRQGKIVLAQWSGQDDPETGGSYAIKRYSSEKRVVEDDLIGWSVTLDSLNPDFGPIRLDPTVEDEVQVIAEFVDVLKPPEV